MLYGLSTCESPALKDGALCGIAASLATLGTSATRCPAPWRLRDSVPCFLHQNAYVMDTGEGAFFPWAQIVDPLAIWDYINLHTTKRWGHICKFPSES